MVVFCVSVSPGSRRVPPARSRRCHGRRQRTPHAICRSARAGSIGHRGHDGGAPRRKRQLSAGDNVGSGSVRMVRRAEPRVHPLDPRASRVVLPDGRALQEQADDIAWFHSIDLGNGVRTRGSSTTRISDDHFPSLEGAVSWISARGTGSTRSWPSNGVQAGSWRWITTPGVSTSRHATRTGTSASRAVHCLISRVTLPTSGARTYRVAGASNSPPPHSARVSSQPWPTSPPPTFRRSASSTSCSTSACCTT